MNEWIYEKEKKWILQKQKEVITTGVSARISWNVSEAWSHWPTYLQNFLQQHKESYHFSGSIWKFFGKFVNYGSKNIHHWLRVYNMGNIEPLFEPLLDKTKKQYY